MRWHVYTSRNKHYTEARNKQYHIYGCEGRKRLCTSCNTSSLRARIRRPKAATTAGSGQDNDGTAGTLTLTSGQWLEHLQTSGHWHCYYCGAEAMCNFLVTSQETRTSFAASNQYRPIRCSQSLCAASAVMVATLVVMLGCRAGDGQADNQGGDGRRRR